MAIRGASLTSVVGLATLLLVVALSVPAAQAAEDVPATAGAPEVLQVDASVLPSGELPSMRTRTSRTFLQENGLHRAELSLVSMNYQDTRGEWQPIDNTLVAKQGGGVENRANGYRLELPGNLSGTVRVSKDDASFGFRLIGADAAADVSGAKARYQSAFPGATVSYTALPDAVKEEITLASAAAPSSFTFALEPGPGLTPKTRTDGAIEFVDSAGAVRFTLAAPFIVDAAGARSEAVEVDLAKTPAGTLLKVTPDSAWLTSPARRFPVALDPTLIYTDPTQAMIRNGGTSRCNGLDVGFDGTNKARALLKYPLSSTPWNVEVLHAELKLYLLSSTSPNPVAVDVHGLTRSWTNPTWTTASGGVPWTTPGGDFEPAAAATKSVGPAAGYNSFFPTNLVRAWVNGSKPNHGFLVKTQNEAANGVVCFDGALLPNPPTLEVMYDERTGERPSYTFERDDLSDRMTLATNVANGNRMINALDLAIAGTGLDLTLSRHYNSAAMTTGAFGRAWFLNTGQDVKLVALPDGSVAFHGPSRYVVAFQKNADGSFTPPSGIGAALIKNGDASYKLTWNASGEKWNFTSAGRLTSQVDENGNAITLSYNPQGRLSSILDTKGQTTTLAYNTDGYVQTITDPFGRTNQYGYDQGQLINHTNPGGKVSRFQWIQNVPLGWSSIREVTDARGNILRDDAIACGAQNVAGYIRLFDPLGSTGARTCFAFNQGNTVLTDPNGHTTTYHYDENARVKRVIDALGNEVSTTYTSDSNIETYTAASTGVTTNGYDTLHNLTSSQIPTGATARFEYNDPLHKFYVTKATDPQANWIKYTYGASGNLETIENPTTINKAQFTYNANGTVATAKDFKGITTSYGYTNGNLTSADNPAPLGDMGYGYDSLNRLTSETDGKGQLTTFAYDPLDRVTTITYQGGQVISYTYDPNGNVLTTTDNTGTSTYEYDALNRLTKETLPGSNVITYSYDAAGNLTSMTGPTGTATYLYNAVNLLTSLSAQGSQTTFVYDVDHLRTETRYPGGVTLYFRYDASNRLFEAEGKKPASGTVLTRFTYSFRNAQDQDTALRQSVTDKDGNKTTYAYDGLNRLVSAEERTAGGSPVNSYTYAYDLNSNRTSQTVNGQTTAYTYNNADQLTSAGGVTYSYDGNGNELGNSSGRSFTYNAKDQVASATPAGGSAVPMSYTGPGQFERVTAGSTNYVTTALGLTKKTVGAGFASYARDDAGFLVHIKAAAGGFVYPLYDGLGSVAAYTDAAGSVDSTYKYDPFGKVIAQTGNPAPYRFLGGFGVYFEQEAGTGLYKMGTRYYDPALGRFTQVDPLPNGSTNRYDYATQNPINNCDYDGMQARIGVRICGFPPRLCFTSRLDKPCTKDRLICLKVTRRRVTFPTGTGAIFVYRTNCIDAITGQVCPNPPVEVIPLGRRRR